MFKNEGVMAKMGQKIILELRVRGTLFLECDCLATHQVWSRSVHFSFFLALRKIMVRLRLNLKVVVSTFHVNKKDASREVIGSVFWYGGHKIKNEGVTAKKSAKNRKKWPKMGQKMILELRVRGTLFLEWGRLATYQVWSRSVHFSFFLALRKIMVRLRLNFFLSDRSEIQ
jgi:hypothetical protein